MTQARKKNPSAPPVVEVTGPPPDLAHESAPHREIIHVPDDDVRAAVAGVQDGNLRLISQRSGMKVVHRGQDIVVHANGRDAAPVMNVVRRLVGLVRAGHMLHESDVERSLTMLERNPDTDLNNVFLDTLFVTQKGRPVAPRGLGQKAYVDAIRSHDVTLGVGPAGSGKTYLAMAAAVAALSRRKVGRIILTRPAVEAGERLGFLPGDLEAKVNPYLRPLYDALHDLMGFDETQLLMQKGVIEVAPLAFMRGRTLNDAFVILDEAQNTTHEQMKMFLTRLGFGSRAVVTGDITQVDLPQHRGSGLVQAMGVLVGVPGVAIRRLTDADIVRHPVVQAIVRAYDAVSVNQVPPATDPGEPA